jgi:hypothetical protein
VDSHENLTRVKWAGMRHTRFGPARAQSDMTGNDLGRPEARAVPGLGLAGSPSGEPGMT